jgi:hypothetical protein
LKKADFGCSINLRLPSVLSLSQNGGSHQSITVLFADEIRSLEKDGCAVIPRHRFPTGLGGERALDCPCDSCLVCLVIRANMPRMIRRNQLLGKLARLVLLQQSEYAAYTKSKTTHRFPINDYRDLKGKLLLHLRDRGLQGCALR